MAAHLIFWGLLKKVVVADNLEVIVRELFGRWETLDGGLALLAIYAFAFQIYGDFSGYTDIAHGVSKCLGFELSLNFNLPYFATSPRDFWNRWHISLSKWLRDYVYFSLGGNRGGTVRTYRNLMLTMILGGLWHGAAWTYVIWGVYQGFLLVLHRAAEPWLRRIEPDDPVERRCWTALRIVVTFHLVCLGWLIFRASSFRQAMGMLSAIVHRPAVPAASYLLPVLVTVIPLLVVQLFQYLADDLDVIARTPWYVRSASFIRHAFMRSCWGVTSWVSSTFTSSSDRHQRTMASPGPPPRAIWNTEPIEGFPRPTKRPIVPMSRYTHPRTWHMGGYYRFSRS